MVHMVGEIGLEDEKPIGEVGSEGVRTGVMESGRSDGKCRKANDDAQVDEISRRHASGAAGNPASTDAKWKLHEHNWRRQRTTSADAMHPRELEAPGARTLEAWMPKKIELRNKHNIFRVEENEEEAEAIGAIKAEEESGVVRVTVDIWAAKSVWPRSKK